MQHKLVAVTGKEFRWKCADFHLLPANCQTLKIYAQAVGTGKTHNHFHHQ
ncbi:MAG: hypothetical protein ABI180_10195 [Microcoleus sp.]|jgi:hypothetical protein